MRIASIDLGTNTILLLIADVGADRSLTVVDERLEIARLGKGVGAEKRIAAESFLRCERHLRAFADIIRASGAEVIRATGTSALRDAVNREEFIAAMRDATGITFEVLSGEDEARWSYAGAVSGLRDAPEQIAVLDIGGGSTELIVGDGREITAHRSIDIGAVRLTERFLRGTPPSDADLEACIAWIAHEAMRFPDFDASRTAFVGVAGTVTTLAAIELGLTSYDGARVSGCVLTADGIRARFEQMRRMSHDALVREFHIEIGRADVILAGVAILLGIMDARGVRSLIVSDRGLRYGIALREVPPA